MSSTLDPLHAAAVAFQAHLMYSSTKSGTHQPKRKSKLLQVLETRTFRQLGSRFDEREKATEARIIAATNKNLIRLVEEGHFRTDLYDRLMWTQLALPPLRSQHRDNGSTLRPMVAKRWTAG